MERLSRPLDEEWNRLDALQTEFIHHSERLPLQHFSIGPCAGAVARAEDLITGFASILCRCSDVPCRSRPRDQSRLGERAHVNGKVVSCLCPVGRDYFNVLPSAKRDERVARADAGVACDPFTAPHQPKSATLLQPPSAQCEIP